MEREVSIGKRNTKQEGLEVAENWMCSETEKRPIWPDCNRQE